MTSLPADTQIAAESGLRPARRRLHLGARRARGGPLPADPARAGRDRGRPRLPALLPGQPLVPEVRAARADPALGRVHRASTTTASSSTTRSSGTRSSGRSSSRSANVGLTMVLGTLIALLLVRVSTWVRIPLTVGLVLVWSMPVVVAVQLWYWMTNFENGILNSDRSGSASTTGTRRRRPRSSAWSRADRLGRDPVRRRSRSTPAWRRCRTSSSRRPRSTARGRGASSGT